MNTKPPFAKWALVPVVLLTVVVAGLGAIVWVATNDPGFATEPDYYRKAINWDAIQAEKLRSERLGWRVNLSYESEDTRTIVTLNVSDRQGHPLALRRATARAFHNARANNIHQLNFQHVNDGTYRAMLSRARPGLWEFRLELESSTDTIHKVIRTELARPSHSQRSDRLPAL